jgi:hypothetical protein
MNQNELTGYKGRFCRVILNDDTVLWGRITGLSYSSVYVDSSRNGHVKLSLADVKGVI